MCPVSGLFTLANALGGEHQVAASETPASRFDSTLITLARALERLSEILQHPALQTVPEPAPDQPADTADTVPVALGEPAPPPVRAHGHEPLMTPAAPSPVPPPVGERAKRSISQDVKIAVSARDGGRCRQCGSTHQLHFDHVIPISRGGANTVANIQLLCGACNRAKGAKLKLTVIAGILS
jgi:hypothetical protein